MPGTGSPIKREAALYELRNLSTEELGEVPFKFYLQKELNRIDDFGRLR